MLYWALVFFIIAIVAGVFGFGGISAAAAGIAQLLFYIFVVIFLIASVWTLSKGHPGAVHKTIPGGFLIELGATFGYAVGWNPYASDYTRYFKPETSKRAIALWAGLGLFLSCVLLETVGAAAATLPSVQIDAIMKITTSTGKAYRSKTWIRL